MARTDSAVFGLSGSTMDCATVPSMASASALRFVFSRCSTSTRLSRSPFSHSTPAPLENNCRAAVTQNGSTVSFCCGMSAAAMVSKSRGLLASKNGDQRGARGVQRIQKHVARRIEERFGVAAHLVVDHAPVASVADLLHQVRDQYRLARTGGTGHDGVLGLGPFRVGDPRDSVGWGRSGQPMQCPRPKRAHAPGKLPRRHQFRASHALFLFSADGPGSGTSRASRSRAPHRSSRRARRREKPVSTIRSRAARQGA